MKNKTILVAVIAVIIIIAGWWYYQKPTPATGEPIKIGIITDLTGPAAYWGESTRIGAEIAAEEMRGKGYDVSLIFEDYQLEAAKAASAAQKLLTIDKVDGLYVEFNPGAIAVSSFAKDSNKLLIYDAAIVSPLEQSPYIYKTYLDYQAGCREIASKFKKDGLINKVGLLKINLEAGELCARGIGEVFDPAAIVTEEYNLGDTDFRTQILKIKNNEAQALVNVGFEGDTYNALKNIKELGFVGPYATVDDSITKKVLEDFSEILKGGMSFGFTEVDNEFFKGRVDEWSGSEKPSTYYGAALAYIHLKQMIQVLDACGDDISCTEKEMSKFGNEDIIGFTGFNNRIAELKVNLIEY